MHMPFYNVCLQRTSNKAEQFKLPLLVSAATKEELVVLVERAENYVQQEQPYHLALNSIHTQEHGDPHRKARWLNQDSKQIDWISISDDPLILPSSCQQLPG